MDKKDFDNIDNKGQVTNNENKYALRQNKR